MEINLNDIEKKRLRHLSQHFQGNASSNRHINDAHHVFESIKYGGGYFITEDKRIQEKAIGTPVRALSRHKFLEILEEFNISKSV